MNVEMMNQAWVNRLGWALLHSLWQGALAALVFAMVRYSLRRCSANARYMAASVMLVLVVAGPVVTFCAGPSWFVPKAAPKAEAAALMVSPAHRVVPSPYGTVESIRAGLSSQARWLDQALPGIVLIWVAGVGLSSCRWARGCWQIRQLRTEETEAVGPEWLATLNDLRLRLEVSRPVRLLQSALVEVPTLVGWLRPVILLPAGTLAGLTPAQMEAILAHELAHVRRGDYVVNAIQNLIEIVMFYHPAVWWLSREIREEREHCCDDLVLRHCADRLVLAQALATLEDLRISLPRMAFGAAGGALLQRIRRLAGAVPADRPAGRLEYGGLSLLGLGLAIGIAGGCLLLSPRCFRAIARLRVTHDLSVRLDSEKGTLKVQDPYYLQTECEVLTSREVLRRVVERLGLDAAWKPTGQKERLSKTEAVESLRSRLSVAAIAGTELVEVRAVSRVPKEAAEIADAVALSYQELRRDRREASGSGLEALTKQYQAFEARIQTAQREVERVRRDLRISDSLAEGDAAVPVSLTAETLRRLEALRIENQAECVRQETLLVQLKALSREKLMQVLPTTVDDRLLVELRSQSDAADLKLASVRKEYGEQHPEVVRASAQARLLEEKLDSRVSGILTAMELRVASLKANLDRIAKEVSEARDGDIKMANEARPYFDAKRNLEELLRFKQVLSLKMASEKIDGALPRESVEVIEPAQEPAHPFSPNVPRAAALILLGCLMGAFGLWMVRG